MRTIYASQIEQAVCDAMLQAHFRMDAAIGAAVTQAAKKEHTELARSILGQILDNYAIAAREQIPICQDSGMTLIYAQVGQQVQINGDFEESIQAGVRRAHQEGYLRASVVKDPLFHRDNTGERLMKSGIR